VSVATPSPNIWQSPHVYERLNRAADPHGLVVQALAAVLEPVGEVGLAVDVGCGTGYHLPMLAELARRVVGLEPHGGLAGIARRRVAKARLQDRVEVRVGLAESMPFESSSLDVVFSHWAYFFGPGCEPGLHEVERVLRPGGLQVAVDLDVTATHGYATWFAASATTVRDRTATFAAEQGWNAHQLPVVWSFDSRSDLRDVLRIEFPPAVAARALRETVGATIAVPTVMRWRRLGRG
jgi:SAM-dependent methyltransferase